MSDCQELLPEPPPHLSLLQHLQTSHPQSQIALLLFQDDAGAIALAHQGAPIHLEKFPQIGLSHLQHAFLSSELPDALQAEHAIEHIEQAIMSAHLDLRQFHVFTADAYASVLLKWIQQLSSQTHNSMSLDAIEACFNLYASAATDGRMAPELPQDRALWAYLILLRETMHHLHIQQVQVLAD